MDSLILLAILVVFDDDLRVRQLQMTEVIEVLEPLIHQLQFQRSHHYLCVLQLEFYFN